MNISKPSAPHEIDTRNLRWPNFSSIPEGTRWILATTVCAAALMLIAEDATAQTVNLGGADNFAILAGSGITNTGATTINGDVGTFPTTSSTKHRFRTSL
jgi:hypothetical protein